MKLIIAIVQDKDANRLSNQFIDDDVRQPDFHQLVDLSGNTTFMIELR